MVARVGPGELTLREVHRFANIPVRAGGTLHWDILRLYADVLEGLRAGQPETSGAGGLASVGIDSWGVDYGLLDRTGALLGNPVHYRDTRTDGAADLLGARIAAAGRYAATGIQELPFNTIYQLTAAAGTPQLETADTLLLIPDLLGYWLTGQTGAEFTNASTTQLLDVRTGDWAWPLIAAAGIPRHIFPPVRSPGSVIGPVRDDISGLAGLPVVAVGSHDTASAVVAVPAQNRDFAYISSGTWSLVGMELDEPVLSDASRLANFTNEAGVDGRIRYLHNVTGLWLLQESLRVWATGGHTSGHLGGRPADLTGLLADAARLPALASVVDADDPMFLPPGDMPGRICAACARVGDPVPASPPEVVRCILDSLALAYRRTIVRVQELSGRHADVIHMVGGGTRNELLCQLTADACGLPVIAGPAEAAALGNALVQARALGAAPGGLEGLRGLVRATQELRRFEPGGDGAAWEAAARRIAGQSQRALSGRRGRAARAMRAAGAVGAGDAGGRCGRCGRPARSARAMRAGDAGGRRGRAARRLLSGPDAVAHHGPDELAGVVHRGAGPAHVLVRADQDERGAEVLPPGRTVQLEHGEWDAGLGCGCDQAAFIRWAFGAIGAIGAIAADQREPRPKVVVERVTRGHPAMRQPLARRKRQPWPRPSSLRPSSLRPSPLRPSPLRPSGRAIDRDR
jgi:rhamnulokinase